MKRSAGCVVLLALALLIPRPAHANFPQDVPERVQFHLGGVAAIIDTEAGLGPSGGGINAVIVFEDAFDIPIRDESFRFDGTWRMTGRHRLDFGYLNIDRVGARFSDEEYEWGDYIFAQGAYIEAGIRSRFTYAAYRYDFMQQDIVRVSGSFGVSYMDLGASLAANADVYDVNDPPPGGTPVSGRISEEGDVQLPVPLLGLQVDIALHKRVTLQFYSRVLFINGFGIRGGVSDANINVTWFANEHFGIGGGFQRYSINVSEYETEDTDMRFLYDIHGLTGFLKFAF
jgi:hypothetical protein